MKQDDNDDGFSIGKNEFGELELKTTGKALVTGGANPYFVDEAKLASGLYQTIHPALYMPDTTIDSFIEMAVKYLGVGEKWIANARKCQMVNATSITTLNI